MPGFTHLQKAQPITLAHHMGAYFEMFRRDRLRLQDIFKRMNYCPLGSGALAGTTSIISTTTTFSLLPLQFLSPYAPDTILFYDHSAFIKNAIFCSSLLAKIETI